MRSPKQRKTAFIVVNHYDSKVMEFDTLAQATKALECEIHDIEVEDGDVDADWVTENFKMFEIIREVELNAESQTKVTITPE